MSTTEGISDELVDEARRLFLSGDRSAFQALATQLTEEGVDEEWLVNLCVIEHQCSLRQAEQLTDEDPNNAGAWRNRAEVLRRAHRLPESTSVLQKAVTHCPEDMVLKKQLAERYLGARCYAQAIPHVEDALKLSPSSPDFLRLRAELKSRTHAVDAAQAAADAWDAQPNFWPRCMDIMLRAGALDLVRDRLKQLATIPDHTLRASGALARLTLWSGDAAQAIAAGEALIDADSGNPEGHFLRGAGRAHLGTPGGLADLERCLQADRSWPSWVERSAVHGWLCELALQRNDLSSALRHADLAMSSAEHYSANALLCRYRTIQAQYVQQKMQKEKKRKSRSSGGWFRWLFGRKQRPRHRGQHVDPRWRPVVTNYGEHTKIGPENWEHDFSAFGGMLSFIHTHIGGNRSSISTWRDDEGHLHPISAANYSHIGTRSIQQQLRCRPHQEVVDTFVDLCERYPTNPGVHTYGGEVLVWLGNYAQSEPYFRAALEGDYTTVWAWIGLGAARGLQGHLEEALEIFADGIEKTQFEGPSVFVYRGEFHRLLGNREAAERDLDKAVQHKPQRLSAWINRVRLDAEAGDDGPQRSLGVTLKRTNPGLWCDAADSIGVAPTDLEQSGVILDAILALMRGNRSSQVITYRHPQGELRFAKWTTASPPDDLCRRYGVTMS